MTGVNEALVRSIYAKWNRGDYSDTDWADPEIEFALADGPDPETWTGIAGMREGWRAFRSAWSNLRAEAVGFRWLDDEHVVVSVRFSGSATGSGMALGELPAQQVSVVEVRNGKVTRLALYWHLEAALADLGYEE